MKEGDISDRHQLSTSNHLRNSHQLNELEDSSRRSTNGNKANALPLNKSVTSGDYSNGSGSSSKKKAMDIDIGQSDIKLHEFKAHGQSERGIHNISNSMRKYSIKEELAEEDQVTPIESKGSRQMKLVGTKTQDDNYSDEDYLEDQELEQKMKTKQDRGDEHL